MDHFNGNVLASIDIETTGPDPEIHEIVQIAIIPLKYDFTPMNIIPYDFLIRPEFPENIDLEALRKIPILGSFYKEKLLLSQEEKNKVLTLGLTAYTAAEILVEWFEEKLKLAPYKRIIPLGMNYAFDRSFIIKWLGMKTYELIFDSRYRDVLTTSLYLNDRAGWTNSPYPFQKNNLQYLCSTLKIERTAAHTALDDALVTAQIYKRLMEMV